MAERKRIMQVMGTVFNVTDYIELGSVARGWQFSREVTEKDYAYADRLGKIVLPVGSNHRLSARMIEPTPAWFARMTGGTVENGRGKWTTEVITRAANTITLTNGAAANQAVVGIARVVSTTDKTRRYKVASSPVAGASYTLATNVLTVHADDTGTTFEVTYYWTDTSALAGSKLVIPVQTMPGKIRILLPYIYQNLDDGTFDKTLYIDCANVQPIGGFTIGGEVQSDVEVPFDAVALNETAGDITMYFDNYNPLY